MFYEHIKHMQLSWSEKNNRKIAVRTMTVAPGELHKYSDWQTAEGNSGSWYIKSMINPQLARIHRFL